MKKVTGYKRIISYAVAILSVVLLSCSAFFYISYANAYQQRLLQENLGNIANLNRSSAIRVTTLIESWNIKLEDIIAYAEENNMTYHETLEMISKINTDSERHFELIGEDYSGHLAEKTADGEFIPISYANGSYADLLRAFDDVSDTAYDNICFAPEFTDSYTALKYFSLYNHIDLKGTNGKSKKYTLMIATKSVDVLSILNEQTSFTGQSTILINESGSYIVSSNSYKSDNFFQYLYVYNDLTLDERNEIKEKVRNTRSGELYFKNAAGDDCVFRYEHMKTNNWCCITCVPLSSFATPTLTPKYLIVATCMLLVTLIMDTAWLQYMNKSLRLSVTREKEASNAKTDFLSRMSHDIRTPLNGIIGLTTLALDEDSSPQMKEYLENIKVSGEFLTGLVNDILDLSKVESRKVELNLVPYTNDDLHKHIEAVVEPLCREKGLNFEMQASLEGEAILLDKLRFNQVLFNILSNAVKYTPSGGKVSFNLVRTNLLNNCVGLDITISDNGIGMSEDFQKHMFEAFSQECSQTANTGTGLGLAIVNSLVSLMGGSIKVESKEKVGTTFMIHLETVYASETIETELKDGNTNLEDRHVLLCEDNQINVMVITKMLEKWGMIVDVAENGQIGIDIFRKSEIGYYDIILMDILMPELNGIEATKRIRKLDRKDSTLIPILAMTANAYDTDVRNCLDAGMNAHMGKPVDRDQLHTLLSTLIREKQHDNNALKMMTKY